MRAPARSKPRLALCAAAVLAWTGCLFGGGIDTATDGGGSSVARELSGRIVSSSGAPVSGAQVRLFPSGYDPSSSSSGWAVRIASTDSTGRFVFAESAATGLFASAPARAAYYSVVVRGPGGLQWAFADSLRARPVNGKTDTLRLAAPRRLVISLHADSTFAAAVPGTAFLPGTDILLPLDGSGAGAVDSVPAAALRLMLRATSGWSYTVGLPPRDPGADASVRDTLRIRAAPTGARVER